MIYRWFLASALMLITACSTAQTDSSSEAAAVQCKEPRPMMCTMDYTPVCGLHKDHSVKTYSNGCSACAVHEVVSWTNGECPEVNGRVLNKEQVIKLFSGNTYQAEIPSRKLMMTVYVDPNGILRGMQNGHKFTSKWTVNEQGEMCVSYKIRMSCRKVVEQDGVYKKIKIDDTGEPVVLVVYHSFTQGNPENY